MGPANKTVCGFDNAESPSWQGCPNWQETNLTEFPPWSYGINNWTHAGFLELAAGFIPWYKGPADAPFPPVTPDKEGAFFFYNLQAINTTCPKDPVGPSAAYAAAHNPDPQYQLEDVVYLSTLLATNASATVTSGTLPPVLFNLTAGYNYVKTAWSPGKQTFRMERAGAVLAEVSGTELYVVHGCGRVRRRV